MPNTHTHTLGNIHPFSTYRVYHKWICLFSRLCNTQTYTSRLSQKKIIFILKMVHNSHIYFTTTSGTQVNFDFNVSPTYTEIDNHLSRTGCSINECNLKSTQYPNIYLRPTGCHVKKNYAQLIHLHI